jgi:hypothetical protein
VKRGFVPQCLAVGFVKSFAGADGFPFHFRVHCCLLLARQSFIALLSRLTIASEHGDKTIITYAL